MAMARITRAFTRLVYHNSSTLLFIFYFFTGVVSALEPDQKSVRFTSIDKCLAKVVALNNTTPALQNLGTTLSLPQCLEICGEGYGRYPLSVVIPALADWVMPLFLLLGNVTYTKSSTKMFSIRGRSFGAQLSWLTVISHLLVNPAHFLWSVTLKLDLGERIYERCDKVARDLSLLSTERKDLCAVIYALSDFQGGKWVDVLLCPLEETDRRKERDKLTQCENSMKSKRAHWEAIKPALERTAQNLAQVRQHSKLHSFLAIMMYGKDVFEALIQAQYDKSFPYHMPHTLALRQLYYWLFLAIIISGAVGGFGTQWASQDPLEKLLEERRRFLKSEKEKEDPGQEDGLEWDDIQLKPIEPWNGGNYSWMHPQGTMETRKLIFLLLVILGVGQPVAFAFYMSWSTPTVGMGDRGRMELCYMGMWIFNFLVSICAGKLWEAKKWDPKTLFLKWWWWDVVLGLGSLYVLFGAFQGWFNNCRSWSGYYSRGPEGAEINLKMKDVIEAHIFTFYLPMVAVAMFAQLAIAAVIIWMSWNTMSFTAWSDEENRAYQNGERGELGRKDVEDRCVPCLP